MPIYEFFCKDCNTIFNFFSSRINTEKIPECPKCKRKLQKLMSMFATIGKAKEEGDDMMPDIDEAKMERVMGELMRDAENLNEDDPKQMAAMMRKFTEKTGMDLGDGMQEAIARMEAGEDPEQIEKDMGDVFENEDPLAMFAKKAKKGGHTPKPAYDDTLYEL